MEPVGTWALVISTLLATNPTARAMMIVFVQSNNSEIMFF